MAEKKKTGKTILIVTAIVLSIFLGFFLGFLAGGFSVINNPQINGLMEIDEALEIVEEMEEICISGIEEIRTLGIIERQAYQKQINELLINKTR